MILPENILRRVPLMMLALTACVSVSGAGLGGGLTVLLAAFLLARSPRSGCLPPGRVIPALFALMGAYLLATILATPFPHNWTKLGEELWIKLLLVAVPLMAAGDAALLRRLLRLVLGGGCLAAGFAVLQYFLGHDPIRDQSIYRPQYGHVAVSGFFGHHLSYAGQVLVVFLMLSAWWLNGAGTRGRLILTPLLAVVGLSLLWNFSRSAWLGSMAGTLVLILLQGRRVRWWTLGAGAVALGAAALLSPVRVHFLSIFALDQHLTRLNLWHTSWLALLDNPLLGLGPGNFGRAVELYLVPGHFNTLGHAHNDLLMHGVNAGFPGLLAALFLLLATCRVFWRARRTAGQDLWVFNGALAVQVGITVAGIFQVYQTDDEVELLLYFLLGLVLALAGPRRTDRAAPGG